MSGLASFTKTWHTEPYAGIDPTRPELNAAGKFLVVTGGGTGIGKATAIAFAKAGVKTIGILGRRLEKLEEAAKEIAKYGTAEGGVQVLIESADISQRASLDAAAASLVSKAGGAKVDILLSGAGVCPDPGPVEACDEAKLRADFDLTFIGAFNTIQSFAPTLVEKGATILNISTGMIHMAPWPGNWLYTASKMAVVRMFDYLQSEHPDWHVVQIQPGLIATDFNSRFGVVGQDTIELPAQFMVWLASPEAEFLKGKFAWANWDIDELKARADEVKDGILLRVGLHGVDM